MNDKIWTIGRILKWTEQYFKDKGIESPRLDAEVLLAHVLEKQRIYLYVHFDEPLQPAELAAYREMIKQRVLHVPVAQILGEKEFMGLTFKVTADTLVPRPDTEILVQAAVERLKAMKGEAKAPEDEALADGEEASSAADRDEAAADVSQEPLRIADIGTGSGAICLSVLRYLAGTVADTVDISPEARAVAEENAASLGLYHLCAAHLSAIAGDKGIQRHILAFKWGHTVSVLLQDAAQACRQQALSRVGHGPLNHNILCHSYLPAQACFIAATSISFSSCRRTAMRYQPLSNP